MFPRTLLAWRYRSTAVDLVFGVQLFCSIGGTLKPCVLCYKPLPCTLLENRFLVYSGHRGRARNVGSCGYRMWCNPCYSLSFYGTMDLVLDLPVMQDVPTEKRLLYFHRCLLQISFSDHHGVFLSSQKMWNRNQVVFSSSVICSDGRIEEGMILGNVVHLLQVLVSSAITSVEQIEVHDWGTFRHAGEAPPDCLVSRIAFIEEAFKNLRL